VWDLSSGKQGNYFNARVGHDLLNLFGFDGLMIETSPPRRRFRLRTATPLPLLEILGLGAIVLLAGLM